MRIAERPVLALIAAAIGGAFGFCSAAAGRGGPADAVAAVFAPFAPKVKTRADADRFYVESDGMADHPMMVGIRSWQQQVPVPQPYTGRNAWQFPLRPTPAAQPLSAKERFFRGAIAIAANGVPIFNALNNRGEDAYLAGELDEYGGHSGRADDYHYHTAPLALEKVVGKGKPIAYALDGYPLYGLTDPDGATPRDLDSFNGHTTAALGYHYHATKTYPYVNGGFHGQVTEREGQVDPQPAAAPLRPAFPPLRGATVTGFTRTAEGRYSLTYAIAGKTCRVDYRREADGSYTFEYVLPTGTETRTYRQGHGRQGGAGEPGPAGRDRPVGQGRGGGQPPAPALVSPKPTDFQLTSPVVADGGDLPRDFSCDGAGVSPPVAWKNAPAGTRAFALVMHHVPPGGEEPHVYWVVYGIPPTTDALPKDDRATGRRGPNTVNRRLDYAPPCSQGPGKKWYTLTLYALSEDVRPGAGAVTRETLLKGIEGHTLGTAVLNVAYTRTAPEGNRP